MHASGWTPFRKSWLEFTMVFMRPVKVNPYRASAFPPVLEYIVMPGIGSGTDFQALPLTNTGRWCWRSVWVDPNGLFKSKQRSMIPLPNHQHGHYSLCNFVQRDLNNAQYNRANTITGKQYLVIIFSKSVQITSKIYPHRQSLQNSKSKANN